IFFFQAEDGIRDYKVTGVQTCALPISMLTILFAILLVAPRAAAQSWTPPAESQRCPSKWGAGDERGSGNLMKPEQVLKATKLIRSEERRVGKEGRSRWMRYDERIKMRE